MKNIGLLKVVIFLTLVVMISCNKEKNPQPVKDVGAESIELKSEVQFSIDIESANTSSGRKTESQFESFNDDVSSVLITIKNDTGGIEKNREEIVLYELLGEYLTAAISLKSGTYSVEEFLVIDANNNITYATPNDTSDLASFVSNPLPYHFEVTGQEESTFSIQVLSTEGETASAFGLSTFSLEFIRTQRFFVSALVYDSITNSLRLDSLDYALVKNGVDTTYGTLLPKINTVSIPNDTLAFFEFIPLRSDLNLVSDLNSNYTFEELKSFTVDNPLNLVFTKKKFISPIQTDTLVSTYAGNGTSGFLNGMGVLARFNNPRGIVIDPEGTVYVADAQNNIIRKITPDQTVSTFAGSSQGSLDGSEGTFNNPVGITLGYNNELYVADAGNHSIRKVTLDSKIVSTVTGSSPFGFMDGHVSIAKFHNPTGILVSPEEAVFVVGWGHRIRKISSDMVNTFAGTGVAGFRDGSASQAQLSYPSDLIQDKAGNLYVVDENNHCIRKISSLGEVTIFAGVARTSGLRDGNRSQALFNYPSGIAIDDNDNIYVADRRNHCIRKIASFGVVSTIAGDGVGGYKDGKSSEARFLHPERVAVNASGDNIFISDSGNHCIRKITFPD
ncbi:MAG: hypothetical protein JXR03_18445 [Cyclobacteriaceae bacterium]